MRCRSGRYSHLRSTDPPRAPQSLGSGHERSTTLSGLPTRQLGQCLVDRRLATTVDDADQEHHERRQRRQRRQHRLRVGCRHRWPSLPRWTAARVSARTMLWRPRSTLNAFWASGCAPVIARCAAARKASASARSPMRLSSASVSRQVWPRHRRRPARPRPVGAADYHLGQGRVWCG